MKRSIPLLLTVILSVCCNVSNGQLLKKIKDEARNRAENKVVNKASTATDKAIDNTADAFKNGAKAGVGANDSSTPAGQSQGGPDSTPEATMADYTNYDFVPGDNIIFEPDLTGERDAELPARFTVEKGNAEIQTFEGEKILHLQPDGNATVAPLIEPGTYLPDQFTLEFDMMYETGGTVFKFPADASVNFRKAEDKNYGGYPLCRFMINGNSNAVFGDQNAARIAFPAALAKSMGIGDTWHHIAVYVRKNLGKAYIDQYRVVATNTLPTGAAKIDITGGRYGIKIKNVRLAAGGGDKYNKILTDGKFVTHGILFDVNKATIKPESMGALNEVAKLMKDHEDLKFEVDGHTDSDGNDDANLKLSQARADAVKATLVSMGIAESRLATKGFGETKPIDKNDNPEGKANNRRVEFVKR